MYKLYKVDAVHDILQRVIKSNLNYQQLTELIDELRLNGYEEDNILTTTNKIYEEDDKIAINKELFDSLPDKGWDVESIKKAHAKRTIRYMFGENPSFPLKLKLKSLRTDNESGHLIAEWENPVIEEWKQSSVWWLEDIGFEFKQPEFEKIPIDQCDDSLLHVNDLIIKYLMLQNKWTEEVANRHLKPVYEAMKKAKAVFYQP